MTLIKFNDEMILRFIRAYRDAACLWDTKHPNYKDRSLRSAVYQYLCDVMNIPGFTVNDVKNKIKNIRSTYCQELKKIHQHRMLGLESYVPTNVWFAEFDEFMSSNIAQRDTLKNYMMLSGYPMGEFVLTENSGSADLPRMVSSVNSINGDVGDFGDNGGGNGSTVEQTLRRLEKLSQSLITQQQKQKEDEFDCFGKSVAQQLRKLPLVRAMKLKIKMQTLLSEERIESIDKNEKTDECSRNTYENGKLDENEKTNKKETKNTQQSDDDDDDVVVVIIDGEETPEELVQTPEIIMEEGDETQGENKEKTVEKIETIVMDDKEDEDDRPASALSLHVSCSSSDEDDDDLDEP